MAIGGNSPEGYPVIRDTQVTSTATAAVYQPGTVFVHKDVNGEWALAKYVQLDNSGCSQGEALVTNYATLKSYSVSKAATSDAHRPHFRGIAAATIASQSFGFMFIGGYVEKADSSITTASGDYLGISASTAGKLTTINPSPNVFAVARTAFATGVGSVSIIGMWG